MERVISTHSLCPRGGRFAAESVVSVVIAARWKVNTEKERNIRIKQILFQKHVKLLSKDQILVYIYYISQNVLCWSLNYEIWINIQVKWCRRVSPRTNLVDDNNRLLPRHLRQQKITKGRYNEDRYYENQRETINQWIYMHIYIYIYIYLYIHMHIHLSQ